MSAGCVPVVVNNGGHREIIIHSENGYLWDTVETLISITLELIHDKSKLNYFSKFAQERSTFFSEDKFKIKLLELI